MESRLVEMCLESAAHSRGAVEAWRRQRRTLENMPNHLAEALLHRLLRRRLLFPSLLEVFKSCVEGIDLKGESYVDAEWMAYIGAFDHLCSLNLSDCNKINNSAIWAITGMTNLKELDLSRCSKITDAGLRHLTTIPILEKLWIPETGVTADGVILLTSLTNLSLLDLGGLHVSDSALCKLKVLGKLQHLDLWGSEVSNKGASHLKWFPRLRSLNLAWTKVTMLPGLPSLACLNMSNCTIHCIFEGEGERALLTKLILSGATIRDVSEAFLHLETSSLCLLDLSNSSLNSYCFLPYMSAISDLDLSGTSVGDESVEHIALVGQNLHHLNLSRTKLSSAGLGTLAGFVPNLETLLLSYTAIDDSAIPFMSTMPLLKCINLSGTNIRGISNEADSDPNCVSSLSELSSLDHLERLDLEETRIKDSALAPLPSFRKLSYLFLRSGSLTDTTLHQLSSIRSLITLGIRDGVLTDSGLYVFNPPPTLKILDLRGCWLLTEDALLSFQQMHPQIEVKHDLLSIALVKRLSVNSPLSQATPRTKLYRNKKGGQSTSPLRSNIDSFLDQRLKYTREELFAMRSGSASISRDNVDHIPHELANDG
ncbi:putative endoglucanase 6-like [Capsicum annuum]|nr:F-box/LRR-repeat protein 3 [Capsicum annuum]KAF3615458.1 putative endoglucanase 6-like [Capsicum annuum]